MPDKVLNGQKVKAGGKVGIVMDNADKIKVKFEDGSVGFFENVNPIEDDGSTLKMMEKEATGEDPLAQKGKEHESETSRKLRGEWMRDAQSDTPENIASAGRKLRNAFIRDALNR